MPALIYLALMIIFGYYVCRRFYWFASLPHTIAASFLVGLLFSTWITYITASAFAWSPTPLIWGNLIFLIVAIATIYKLKDQPQASPSTFHARPSGSDNIDWIIIGLCALLACWLMFTTFNMEKDSLTIAYKVWSDFGPNLSIIQSFALGHNFPTEYPHFPGDSIRYHFLFWFQAGNLTFLGLSPHWSLNLLSVLSITSMLILVMTLSETLFNTRIVGRIAALLFFIHGSLSYFSFLRSYSSISQAIQAIITLDHFLPSGYPYRGEDWGVWSLAVFANQRHLTSAIGILILVLIFLIDLIRKEVGSVPTSVEQESVDQGQSITQAETKGFSIEQLYIRILGIAKHITIGTVFSGVLIGLLPMWNGAVFIAALTILGTMFLLFKGRINIGYVAATTFILAIPQIIFLRPENASATQQGFPKFHWGFTIDNPTITTVIKYLSFTFGFKWIFILIALYFLSKFHRLLFAVISSLLAIAFLVQFSEEVLANHKFINMWLIFVNIFVAYGFWQLWDSGKTKLNKAIALMLLILTIPSGIIDLFPFKNDFRMYMSYKNDPLLRWLRDNTKPKDIFLSDTYVNHSILLAGRKLYYGHAYYAWSAGHPTDRREALYKEMINEKDVKKLLALLQNNGINYVAVDEGFRKKEDKPIHNEDVYKEYFTKAYEDTSNKYGSLIIYKVPHCDLLAKEPVPKEDEKDLNSISQIDERMVKNK
jgi:hypothetical protein